VAILDDNWSYTMRDYVYTSICFCATRAQQTGSLLSIYIPAHYTV